MEKRKYTPYVFIAPHLILFIVFFGIPAIFGILISFTQWNLMGTPQWVGLKNYAEILANSKSTFYTQFHNGLKNTLTFTLFSVPFCVIVPLLLAAALNAKPKGHKIFQSIFYLPTLFSISSVILAWGFLFNKNFGPINKILGQSINWGGIQPYVWIAIITITVWWYIGGNMVIYQAAIAGVPADLYEAASLDGAGAVMKFLKITLPSIKNQLAYTLVMTTIAQLNIYGQPLMFSKGGPAGSTSVLLMYIRQTAFGTGESIAGIASAMAVMLGLCIVFVASLQFYFLRDKD
ncbi:carbohydrate ABC transporter permease [Clostridium folliculivorans]|uniref:ABC transporter permease n=1 Tax=Clostridium folliculivorans TaxID=2886038 RepID=A0A9W5XZ92_9CLOT|nr:sugar ABC transporter permease [Clostridium folliculivorans]GKU23713.1 ABC transporter permease [Clostridium folliculivorans]GKU29829.1 ABC transporter permease [Clostridium folliculivorans]